MYKSLFLPVNGNPNDSSNVNTKNELIYTRYYGSLSEKCLIVLVPSWWCVWGSLGGIVLLAEVDVYGSRCELVPAS